MYQDIDTLAEELIKASAFSSSGSGGLPPKLRYKLKKWLKSLRSAETGVKQNDQRHLMQVVKNEIIAAVKDKVETDELAKNEVMASAFNDGSVKMDFGSDVPEEIKKAALKWAKDRGLRPTEASLAKNLQSATSVLFGRNNKTPATSLVCEKRRKWVVPTLSK